MELLFALRYGQPQLAAFAEGLSCALLAVAAFFTCLCRLQLQAALI